jgi:transportin-1
MEKFVMFLLENMDHRFSYVCNNAGWALGEIVSSIGPAMGPLVPSVIDSIVSIWNKASTKSNLSQNMAITLGKFALYCTKETAECLPRFFHAWSVFLSRFQECDDKYSAVQGYLAVVTLNPDIAAQNFNLFLMVIGSVENPPPNLLSNIMQVLDFFQYSLI